MARDERQRDTADTESVPVRYFSHWRAAAVLLVICALFGGVSVRAHFLQVGRAADYRREADSQLAGSVQIRARRGTILDREGNEMAIAVRAHSIFARPRQVGSPRDVARVLAPILQRSEQSLVRDLTSERSFRYLARRVSPEVAREVHALGLPGIGSESEWQRFYPMRHRAGHLIGFVGDDGYGLEGIERAMEEVLAGGTMEVRGLRDALGRPIIADESPELADLEGASVVLTIDSNIQRIAEREIQRAVIEHGARTGVAIVMDPRTGEVLAMTNWPLFDPNLFRLSRPADWRNRAVTDAWEPGSTMKIFTYALALQANLIEPETEIDCNGGRLRVGRHRIRDTHHNEVLPAWQIIQVSSNVGIYQIAALLQDEGLHRGFHEFGFGEETGVGLGGEQRGQLASPPWADIELANRAFGQGLTATPLQMATAYSAIANGGELMTPQVVREIRNIDGEVLARVEPVARRRVLRPEVARMSTEALMRVVERAGTGTRAAIPGIAVAGKTGTAQKVNPETGEYDDIWMASFIGFVPADDPMFTIVVLIDEPQEGHYGGEVAAPAFARIAEQALALRGIFSTREEAEPEVAEVAPVELRDSVIAPPPAPDPPHVWETEAERRARTTVPELRELGLIQTLAALEDAGLEARVHGWGRVRHQWPAAGARVLRGSSVEVFLETPYGRRIEQPLLSARE